MSIRKRSKIFWQILKNTGAYKALIIYLIFFLAAAVLIYCFEPNVSTFKDALWYCFVSGSTTGFGDIVAVSLFGRILTVMMYIASIVIVAIITAVVTNFFIEMSKIRTLDDTNVTMYELEHLDELSKDELKELSQKITKLKL